MRITIENTTELTPKRKVIHEVDTDLLTLDEVLEMIEGLLKAYGFVFNGTLEIKEEEEEGG